jgi:hypothetical protein
MVEKLFWVVTYNVKSNKIQDYLRFNETPRAAEIFNKIENETGLKRLALYHIAFGHEDHEFETWFEIPNYGTIDNVKNSETAKELMRIVGEFFENARWKLVKQDVGKFDGTWKASEFSWL